MAKFEQSNADQFAIQLDDEALSAVVGGAAISFESYLAQQSVGGWTMRDVFARPQIGRFPAIVAHASKVRRRRDGKGFAERSSD